MSIARSRTSKRPRTRPSGPASGVVARPTLRRPVAVVVALVIAAAGAWAYSTSFAGVFVFDDGPAIVENPHIRSIWPLTRSMTAPPEVTVSGRPVACLSLALNYALAPADVRDVMTPVGPTAPPGAADRFHRNVWGYHLLNLAVHVGAGLALFGLIRRSLLAPALAGRYGAHASALAFVASLTWLVHPLHTQAVTYVVQRVESLMGLFYLLTMYCAIRAAESQWNQPESRPGRPRPAGAGFETAFAPHWARLLRSPCKRRVVECRSGGCMRGGHGLQRSDGGRAAHGLGLGPCVRRQPPAAMAALRGTGGHLVDTRRAGGGRDPATVGWNRSGLDLVVVPGDASRRHRPLPSTRLVAVSARVRL